MFWLLVLAFGMGFAAAIGCVYLYIYVCNRATS